MRSNSLISQYCLGIILTVLCCLQCPLLVDVASHSQNSEQGALHSFLKFQGTGVIYVRNLNYTVLRIG
jgi:hypothetical protein